MLSFKHIYNAEKAKAVCNMYTDIEKTMMEMQEKSGQ